MFTNWHLVDGPQQVVLTDVINAAHPLPKVVEYVQGGHLLGNCANHRIDDFVALRQVQNVHAGLPLRQANQRLTNECMVSHQAKVSQASTTAENACQANVTNAPTPVEKEL